VDVFVTIVTINSGKYSIAKTYSEKAIVPMSDRNISKLRNLFGKSYRGLFLQNFIIKQARRKFMNIRMKDKSIGSIFYQRVASFARN